MLTSKPSKIHSRRVADPPTHRLKRPMRVGVDLTAGAAPSSHAAPGTRPISGSAANPRRPRNRRPWVSVFDAQGKKVIGERMAPAKVKGSGS